MTRLVPGGPNPIIQYTGESLVTPVDIQTGYDDDDFVSLSLPSFPASSLNLNQSFVVFTSNTNDTVNFDAGPTDAIPFSASLTPLTNGADCELRFKRGLLTTVDLSAITGVKFILKDQGSGCTFKCLSIRLLHKDWIYAPNDIDTLTNRLHKPVSLTGSTAAASAFPTADLDWPIAWKSDNPTGAADPKPIDSAISAAFNTGTLGAGNTNQISFYFRGKSIDYVTQLELNTRLQEAIEGQGQPDFAEALYIGRDQLNIDAMDDTLSGVPSEDSIPLGSNQSDLDDETQFNLERVADPISAAWIEFRLEFNSSGVTVTITDTETVTPYIINGPPLTPLTDYVVAINLDGTTGRLQIFRPVAGAYQEEIFDSTIIPDPSIFKRRKGRNGWYTHFEDGDAYLQNIRTERMNFAEYRSAPAASISPVAGLQLFPGAINKKDGLYPGERGLYSGINPGPFGGEFEDYTQKSAFAFKINNPAEMPLQGIQTNSFYIEDFTGTDISFELFLPQIALDNGSIYCFLWDGYQAIPLSLGSLKANTWNQISIPLDKQFDNRQSGFFTLALCQTIIGSPTYYIVDRIRIDQRVIDWDGQAVTPDADIIDTAWVPFKNSINDTNAGIVFEEKDKFLQLRAKARRQSAVIGQIKTVPQYAELGNLSWSDDAYPENSHTIAADFTYLPDPNDGSLISFQDTSVNLYTDEFFAITWQWYFGDGGEDLGPSVTHDYPGVGTYPVTLIVTDNLGRQQAIAQNVTI